MKSKLMTRDERAVQLIALVILAILSLCAVLPFVLIFIASFTEEKTLTQYGYTFFPRKLSLDAYKYLANNFSTIGRAYLTSICLTAAGTTLSMLLTTMFAYLCIHGADYVLIALMSLLSGQRDGYLRTFHTILEPGPNRLLFLTLSKAADFSLYLGLRKQMQAVAWLQSRYCVLALGLGAAAYVVMTVLLTLVRAESYAVLQSAVLLAWILLVICVIFVICIFVVMADYQRQKQRNAYLRTTNELMVENYRKLSKTQQTIRQQVHDFNHHLRVLKEFADSQSMEDVRSYLQTLLEAPSQSLALCASGNEVIDAVINCRAADARSNGIEFQYDAQYDPSFQVDPVDLCAILSNQLDNAFEACQQIPQGERRAVRVRVWPQNGNMLFLQVANTVRENPFLKNPELRSAKKDPYQLHGLGLQNIKSTAERYGGDLKSTFQKGEFLSTVFLFCGPDSF